MQLLKSRSRWLALPIIVLLGAISAAASQAVATPGLVYRGFLTDRNSVPLQGYFDMKVRGYQNNHPFTEFQLRKVSVHAGKFQFALQKAPPHPHGDEEAVQEWELEIGREGGAPELFSPRVRAKAPGSDATVLYSPSMILRAEVGPAAEDDSANANSRFNSNSNDTESPQD